MQVFGGKIGLRSPPLAPLVAELLHPVSAACPHLPCWAVTGHMLPAGQVAPLACAAPVACCALQAAGTSHFCNLVGKHRCKQAVLPSSSPASRRLLRMSGSCCAPPPLTHWWGWCTAAFWRW